jgi:hypothetical protein
MSMQRKWKTKRASWGEAIVLVVIGSIFTYLKWFIGAPILAILFIIGVYLIWSAYHEDNEPHQSNDVDIRQKRIELAEQSLPTIERIL